MERINRIYEHELYQKYLKKNEQAEQNRSFCRHHMVHFLDVARIAHILNLEEDLGLEKEHIYAAALLHDIGRWVQYENGMPHEKSSAMLAEEILLDCGFSMEETKEICLAIGNHRRKEIRTEKSLSGVLYRADKQSRPCFSCDVLKRCDWSPAKKNLEIKV